MQDKIQSLIYSSVLEILNNTHLKIPKLQEIHKNKIHFIPTKYRILGGILQSMNIQFGNFSYLSRINDKLIDSYITE
ncbi:hypothetical protein [Helicobacter suis]|uniref:hypothetical protein n=1 Tax=Helicobacter suis TaxID=104628 RepID=UPI001F0826C7|nr:hypothetical protein [Helicobacter suis]